jgi:hypothetical protein
MVTHRGGLRVDTGAPGLSHRPGRRCSKTPPPSATVSKLRLIGPLLPGLRTAEAFGAGPPKPGLPAARFHTAALASLPRPPRQTQCAGADAGHPCIELTSRTPRSSTRAEERCPVRGAWCAVRVRGAWWSRRRTACQSEAGVRWRTGVWIRPTVSEATAAAPNRRVKPEAGSKPGPPLDGCASCLVRSAGAGCLVLKCCVRRVSSQPASSGGPGFGSGRL